MNRLWKITAHSSQLLRTTAAAKRVRTCRTIRVFWAYTVTGPFSRAADTKRRNTLRRCGALPAKCSAIM